MAQRRRNTTRPETPVLNDLHKLYVIDEKQLVTDLMQTIGFSHACRGRITARAASIVADLRSSDTKPPLIDQFLLEYGLSTQEGIILMRLAEALLRTPDISTSNLLLRDRLGAGKWKSHAGNAKSGMVNLSTTGLVFTKQWILKTGGLSGPSLIARLGDRVLQTAVNAAMMIMGEHFVLGRTIEEAIHKSDALHAKGFSFSYDMLGEAAMTSADGQRYFDAYYEAVKALANSGRSYGGLSVKLSALHPRFEMAQASQCVPDLVAKVKVLAKIAKGAGLGLAIDAEEVERLEISLDVIQAILSDPELDGWDGLSIVVQAYQRRASAVIDWLISEARHAKRCINIRLVKGAYWDSEIKRAQEMGLSSYPVFTRKENTDVSYLACARQLFDNTDVIFPQFATHNAHTAAAILEMAAQTANKQKTGKQELGKQLNDGPASSEFSRDEFSHSEFPHSEFPRFEIPRYEFPRFEFQCLHGMGEGLHRKLIKDFGVASRIYAPVGRHADLLPYLVRRLLENGANSSFVNQLFDENVSIDEITTDPQSRVENNGHRIANPALPNPRGYLGTERQAAMGLDLSQKYQLQQIPQWFANKNAFFDVSGGANKTDHKIINPAIDNDVIGLVSFNVPSDIADIVQQAKASNWGQTPVQQRADILRACADLLESEMIILLPLIVREAGKSLNDAIDEVREAVDFCRYYAKTCERPEISDRRAIGVVACISPWNFPLAIFAGQIAANLAVGNAVIAKPAEQTPLIAQHCVALFRRAGVPGHALQLVQGAGDVGAALVADPNIGGVCFTGSTEVAQKINASLANTGRGHAPLIAETGGINAMIVDSTALLEQVVRDVVASAFQSAGQRCSACRLVCIQDDIADDFMAMLSGAVQILILGDPADPATDIGPVIDEQAATMLRSYIETIKKQGRVICEATIPSTVGSELFIAPIAVEFDHISQITQEIFGPVLHIVRFNANDFDRVISDINDLGYGLTMGLHTRIDSRIDRVIDTAKVGNLYVNRNQIGAVVGVQPFGGEGLSGTGPKAGGPHYLYRLTRPQTKSIPQQKMPFLTPQTPPRVVPKTLPAGHDHKQVAKIMQASGQASGQVSGQAQKKWQNADRETILEQAAQQVSPSSPAIAKLLKRAALDVRQYFTDPIILPGPTGEDNSLALVGRGVLVLVGDVHCRENIQAIITALAAGNSVLYAANAAALPEMQILTQGLIDSGMSENVLMPIPSDHVRAIVLDPQNNPDRQSEKNEPSGQIEEIPQIDGLLVDEKYVGVVSEAVASRLGKILPVLCAADEPYRFCHERSCTIDTTAAGGNVSLFVDLA